MDGHNVLTPSDISAATCTAGPGRPQLPRGAAWRLAPGGSMFHRSGSSCRGSG